LRSHGYSPSKIRGVDLFSLFADIEVGDLHQLPFPDNHFDIVLCGWVLAYSENRELAAAEIKRVLRPGGMFSIGVSYSSESNEQQRERRGYLIGAENRIVSCKQVLGYFGDGISEIYFFVEPDKRLKHSQILVTGSVK
jgi:ubiquinone/menaquinone biosynthesis C-methylase UbiE